jgi:hypothetical protein
MQDCHRGTRDSGYDSRSHGGMSFVAENHLQRIFPSLAIYLLGERGRREQTHNDENSAKDTKHLPGLHHKGNFRTMTDKFLCSKYRQVKHERQGANQEGEY